MGIDYLCWEIQANGWGGDGMRVGMTGESDNVRKVVEFVVKGGCVRITHTSATIVLTMVGMGQDGVEVKGTIDTVLVKEDMLRCFPLLPIIVVITTITINI